MDTMIRSFSRHIRDAVKSIFRNGFLTFGAVSAVSMTLLLVGFFTAGLTNVNKIASDIENDVSVRVYIDLAADQAGQNQLQKEIEALPNVESVTFKSRDQELEDITKNVSSDFTLVQNDENPLHDVFDVSASNPEETRNVASAIEAMNYVSKVNYGGAKADKLLSITKTIRNVGVVIIIALILIAMFLISNTIRSTIYARHNEIEIMKLVGAKNSYIRWPFFIEGGIIGLLGSVLPVVVIWFSYMMVYDRSTNFFAGSNYALLTPNPYIYQLTGFLVVLGVLIGALGSGLSVRRFLKV